MKVDVELTPEDLADRFAELTSDEQARFFNRVAEVSSKWTRPFEFQLQSITEEKELTLAGRRIMQGIGEYSHWGLVPSKWKLRQESER